MLRTEEVGSHFSVGDSSGVSFPEDADNWNLGDGVQVGTRGRMASCPDTKRSSRPGPHLPDRPKEDRGTASKISFFPMDEVQICDFLSVCVYYV